MSAPKSTYLFLAIGLVAASQSGNLVRMGDASPVVMAAWRLCIASIGMAVIAGPAIKSLGSLTKTEWGLVVLAGLALCLHLVSWIAAVQLTTVANAAIFFAVNPVLTATSAHFVFRERVSHRLMIAIVFGLCGMAVIGWDDMRVGAGHWAGDVVALVCSVFFTIYFLVGKRLRRQVDTRAYVAAIYAVAALAAFVGVLALKLPLVDYSGRTWTSFVLLALIPTMVGHTSLNHALRHLNAGWVSCATLSEPPMAGLVAAIAWGEIPSFHVVVGYGVIAASVLVLTTGRAHAEQSQRKPSRRLS